MTTKIAQKQTTKEIFRIRFEGEYWLVETLSHVVDNFIVVGEWKTEAQANKDLEMWLNN